MKKQTALLPFVALLAMAASPKTSIVMAPGMPDFTPTRQPPSQATVVNPEGYSAAPTPDQDAFAPTSKASNATSVAPGLFTRRDQYRGEGLSPSSSAQTEQDRRAKPGAGIKFSVPLQ